MIVLGYSITVPLVFNFILHVLGIVVLYKNRIDLLYDNEDCDPCTPNTLSLGRCWSWLLFYLAFSFWLRYLTGEIPPTTPFPPGLQEMLYACLLYEFAKKGMDVSKLWLRGKGSSGNSYSGNSYSGNSYPKSSEAVGNEGQDHKNNGNVPAKAYADDDVK